MPSRAPDADPDARIAEALREHREILETLADLDVEFADRASAALDWLAEYEKDD